jgi:carboxyl-terminal processing protease
MNRFIIWAVLALCASLNSSAQTSTASDSISTFYDSLFHHLETDYLYAANVTSDIKTFVKSKALEYSTFLGSLDATTLLFDTLGDDHCQVFYEDNYFTNTHGKQLNQNDFSGEYLVKYTEGADFEVRLLNKKYGYVLIPGMLLLDLGVDSLSAVAQDMYDQMMAVQKKQKLNGWIIDLRFNIGGNVYPMLASLYHLLGNTTVYTELDLEMNVVQLNELSDGAFISAGETKAQIAPSAKPDTKRPVAIINGLMTASAGEDIAVAFRGRRNVRFIGAETYGKLSGNEEVNLPFGSVMAMTTCLLGDRKGYHSRTIIPDVPVKKKDNFTNLLEDVNIIEAIKFIEDN